MPYDLFPVSPEQVTFDTCCGSLFTINTQFYPMRTTCRLVKRNVQSFIEPITKGVTKTASCASLWCIIFISKPYPNWLHIWTFHNINQSTSILESLWCVLTGFRVINTASFWDGTFTLAWLVACLALKETLCFTFCLNLKLKIKINVNVYRGVSKTFCGKEVQKIRVGVNPFKTHQFWSICKQHCGDIG